MAMEGMDPLYTKLPTDSHHFRLLTILPSADKAAIVECTLMERTIDDAEDKYDALSYCWGDPDITVPAIVNGCEKQVTVNLDDALRQFRANSFPDPMIMWADALCINQDDIAERKHQVSLMGDIYRKASRVRAWLGRGGHVEERGLKAIEYMSRSRCTDENRDKEPPSHGLYNPTPEEIYELQFVSAVCAAPYWRRVWTVQELVLNDNIFLHEGSHQAAVQCWLCLATFKWLSTTSGRDFYYTFRTACPSSSQGGTKLSDAFDIIPYAKQLTRQQPTDPFHVLNLLQMIRPKIATNELDRIYGMLGLLSEYLDITPDYSMTVENLYEIAVAQHILRSGSLEILRHAFNESDALPSWVPDFRVSVSPFPTQTNSDDNEYLKTFSIREQLLIQCPCKGTLMVLGVHFDTIKTITDPPVLEDTTGHGPLASRGIKDGKEIIWVSPQLIDADEARVAFTTNGGFCGVMYATPRVGDHICVLATPGSCMLFTLRSVVPTTPTLCSLVGGCSIWREGNLLDIVSPMEAMTLAKENHGSGEAIYLTPFILV